jgi:hypothetical protein
MPPSDTSPKRKQAPESLQAAHIPKKQKLKAKNASRAPKTAGLRQFKHELGNSIVKDGRIDVVAFTQAREKEIISMDEAMRNQRWV